MIVLALSQALPDTLLNKNKNLEDLYHVLDMVGRGLESLIIPQNIRCKKRALPDLSPP